jgi:adenosylhomocysteine nucleosidase
MEDRVDYCHSRRIGWSMKVLIVEDDCDKSNNIETVVRNNVSKQELDLVVVSSINEALVLLAQSSFDLAVIDLVLPQTKNDVPSDATRQWCEFIENNQSGRTASWVVMTGYSVVIAEARTSFARHNVAVIEYDPDNVWEKLLEAKIKENHANKPMDFLIVCALEKERNGYKNVTGCRWGKEEVVAGLDCSFIDIDKWRGVIVVQPGPGLINAAITTVKALITFRPRAVAMSGICGGRENETSLGDIIVPDISWNYQSGKYKDGKLIPDLLQVDIPPSVRTNLFKICNDSIYKALRKKLLHSEIKSGAIHMLPMVSGSQVVADGSVSDLIGLQGRKVAGIDMEVAAMFFSAHSHFDGGGIFFAAKTVVDLANPYKDDRYHEFGCTLSARFVATALKRLLT